MTDPDRPLSPREVAHLADRLTMMAKHLDEVDGHTAAVLFCQRELRGIAAGLRSLHGIPVGWRLVPVGGTDAMVTAKCEAERRYRGPLRTQAEVRQMMMTGLAAAIEAAPRPPIGPGEKHDAVRHLVRGSTYDVIYRQGEIQAGAPVFEGDTLVTYRCRKTGKVWHRPAAEFGDGRFETIEPAPTLADTDAA